ncbi:MAG TPA: hypothetical protein GX725_01230 [Mollicutes bacterium]|nr:hypothetical protein [Mollicutes bacterium]
MWKRNTQGCLLYAKVYENGAGGTSYINVIEGIGPADFISGGGGSGYIGGVTNGTMESGVHSGNGYAKITYIGQ